MMSDDELVTAMYLAIEEDRLPADFPPLVPFGLDDNPDYGATHLQWADVFERAAKRIREVHGKQEAR